jgi:hypothetical protein
MKGWHFFYEMVLILCTDIVCHFVTYDQHLNRLSDCHESRYRHSLKTVLSRFEFHENRRSDIHTLLKDVKEFSPVISVFID